MFLGCNYRIRKISYVLIFIIFNILIINSAFSNPVLVARAVLPKILGNVISKRAASTELATLTANSVNKLPMPVFSRVSPLLQGSGKALNWIGLGYGLNALQNDLFSGNDKVYSLDYDNQKFIGSSPESLLTQLFEYDIQHNKITCIGEAPCQFSSLRDIRLQTDVGDAVYFKGVYDLTNASGSFIPNRSYIQYFYRGKNQVVFHDGIPYPAENVDLDELIKSLSSNEVPLDDIVNLLNAILMKASLQSDYQGMPFNTGNLITKNELISILNNSNENQKIYFRDLFESTTNKDGDKQIVIINNTTNNNGGGDSGSDIDLNHPDNNPPDLTSPTANEIITPLLDFFPFLKEIEINERNVECPIVEFNIYDNYYIIDSHCGLFEKISGLLKLFSLIIWSFLGLRIVLSS